MMIGLNPIYSARIEDAIRILESASASACVDEIFIDQINRVEQLMKEIVEKTSSAIC